MISEVFKDTKNRLIEKRQTTQWLRGEGEKDKH
jgi:hypothetical protein